MTEVEVLEFAVYKEKSTKRVGVVPLFLYPILNWAQASTASIVLADIPMDTGIPPPTVMGMWGESTYRRIDQAITVCKTVFRAQQEYLQRLIQEQSDDNLDERLEKLKALQALTKDLAELTALKARLRMWEIMNNDGPAPAQGRRGHS